MSNRNTRHSIDLLAPFRPEKEFKTFFLYAYEKLARTKLALTNSDTVLKFDDFFSKAITKLYEKYEGNTLQQMTNEQALAYLYKSVYNEWLQDKRKNAKYRDRMSEFAYLKKDSTVGEYIPLRQSIQKIFDTVDNLIKENEHFLTKQQKTFYNLYKEYCNKPFSNSEIKALISDTMELSPESYDILKSKLKHKLRQVTANYELFYRA